MGNTGNNDQLLNEDDQFFNKDDQLFGGNINDGQDGNSKSNPSDIKLKFFVCCFLGLIYSIFLMNANVSMSGNSNCLFHNPNVNDLSVQKFTHSKSDSQFLEQLLFSQLTTIVFSDQKSRNFASTSFCEDLIEFLEVHDRNHLSLRINQSSDLYMKITLNRENNCFDNRLIEMVNGNYRGLFKYQYTSMSDLLRLIKDLERDPQIKNVKVIPSWSNHIGIQDEQFYFYEEMILQLHRYMMQRNIPSNLDQYLNSQYPLCVHQPRFLSLNLKLLDESSDNNTLKFLPSSNFTHILGTDVICTPYLKNQYLFLANYTSLAEGISVLNYLYQFPNLVRISFVGNAWLC